MGANDTRLSICRRLPASDIGLRLSKEGIDHRFEKLSSGGNPSPIGHSRTAHQGPHIPESPEPVSEDLRPLTRFVFAAGKDAAHLVDAAQAARFAYALVHAH